MPRTLIIIPCYNERENIIQLIDALLLVAKDADVLIVDDSRDDTSDLVRRRQKNESRLHLIQRTKKSGRGTAVLDGFKLALSRDYDRIVEMDADFSHNPQELPSLMEVSGDNTVVIGSRYLKESKILGWPFGRRIFSKLANVYARMLLGIPITDYTNGYRVYGRKALEALAIDSIKSSGYIVLSEISYQLFRKGVSFREVPTIFVNRDRGTSNFSLKEVLEAFTSVIKIRLQAK